MDSGQNLSVLYIVSVATILLLSLGSVNGRYSDLKSLPHATTPSPGESGSQPIIKKLESAEGQDYIDRTRKCRRKENCYHYFLFGCLCYPSAETTSHFSNPTGIYTREITAEMRANGFVAPSSDTEGISPRTSCLAYCHGRDPCFCPFLL